MFAEEVIVTGLVQGVGFRAYVLGLAERHEIRGEVWNTREGAVGIFAEHEDAERLYGGFLRCLPSGPGDVASIVCVPAEPRGVPGFSITGTR